LKKNKNKKIKIIKKGNIKNILFLMIITIIIIII